MSGVERCGHCGSPISAPGDFCLVCRSRNADGVVVAIDPERSTLTVLDGERVVGESVVTTTPEPDPELSGTQIRNYVDRIADEVRRRRPDGVFMAGDREHVRELRSRLHYDCYRVDGDDPVAAAIERRGERDLDVIEAAPEEKLRGSHSTIVGGRTGRSAALAIADHPHVKAVIPGPIEAGGRSGRGATAKVTRADDGGNLRLLLRDGSTVQEVRVVTTAMNRDLGERIRADLNEGLEDADLT